MFKKSVLLMAGTSIVLTAAAFLLAAPLSGIFVGYDAELFALTCHAFRLFAFSFLLAGFNIFTSSFLPPSTTARFRQRSPLCGH